MGTMAAGWMGGIEVGKIVLGRDSQEAWLAGAIVPGGIMGIWTRNLYGGMRTSIFLGALGWIYQYSTNNNLSNTITPHYDNPNMSTGRFNYNAAMFWPTKGEHGMEIHEKIGLHPIRTLDRPGRSGRTGRRRSDWNKHKSPSLKKKKKKKNPPPKKKKKKKKS